MQELTIYLTPKEISRFKGINKKMGTKYKTCLQKLMDTWEEIEKKRQKTKRELNTYIPALLKDV